MKKVITYGTYDLFHYGHQRLLERAKALGDYLIVGVTTDDFDKARGKINVTQPLIERIESVRRTGLADEIIVEEYEGQKIDDVQKYGIDIFTVGDDWVGKFDYMKDYCEVVYLSRTQGVSSSEIRAEKASLRLGLAGRYANIRKYVNESQYVNGIETAAIYTDEIAVCQEKFPQISIITDDYSQFLNAIDAVYIYSLPSLHYEQIKEALNKGKHVLCESPIALYKKQYVELKALAEEKGLILMEAIKTAYSMAYSRLMLMVKTGKIGDVLSVDSICTSLADLQASDYQDLDKKWNSICAWGPTALLPIFQILGDSYSCKYITTNYLNAEKQFDRFTKIAFVFPKAVASIKVGKAVKSEGELIISGTKGYIYVPAPWWKTDYFEIRYENPNENKRFFYQLDGEGIRNELSVFVKAIENQRLSSYIQAKTTAAIIGIIEDYYRKTDLKEI
jgi:choline-phosphate cytidylyltransferase